MSNHQKQPTKPTHHVSINTGFGNKPKFETIGVGWARDDGGVNVRVYGKQIVEGTIFVVPKQDSQQEPAPGGQGGDYLDPPQS